MTNGGYQIVDLGGVNLSENPVMVRGIHESIEGNYHKPILLSGITIGEIERAAVFSAASTESGAYIFHGVYGGIITITSDDSVTYAKNA